MSDSLGNVIAGFKDKWDNSPSLAAIPLSFGERPLGTQENPDSGVHFPYAIFYRPQSSLDGYSCGSVYTSCDISVRVFDVTPELCRAHADLVRAIYDSDTLSLTLSEGSIVRHRPEDVAYEMADKNVYYVELGYVFLHRKPRVT